MKKKPRTKSRSAKRAKAKIADVSLRPGKAASVRGGAAALGARPVDPSDPSGHTIYITAGSGGVWKQTRDIPLSG
jgi:hypothetical protein